MSLLHNTRRRGFTLIELMVAVSVLAIVIAITNMILASSQKVVRISEARMRSNATAAALAKVIRRDLRELTTNGMLCITTDSAGFPELVLLKGNTGQSLTYSSADTTDIAAPLALVSYGMAYNNYYATGSTAADIVSPRILWRRQILMSNAAFANDPNYCKDWDDFRFFPTQLLGNRAAYGSSTGIIANSNFVGAGTLSYPPRPGFGGTDINYAWQIATPYCTNLSIMWTPGAQGSPKALSWYGAATASATCTGTVVGSIVAGDALTQTQTVMGVSSIVCANVASIAATSGGKYIVTLCNVGAISTTGGSSNPLTKSTGNALTYTGTSSILSGQAIPSAAGWASVTDPNMAEFNRGTALAPIYTAMWSQHNLGSWPAAVKIRFTLTDPTMPIEFMNDTPTNNNPSYGTVNLDYEIICPVGE